METSVASNLGTPHKSTLALVLKSPDDGVWRDHASCKTMGNTEFFATFQGNSKSHEERLDRVRTICNECPVNKECLDFAVRNEIAYGVWGGLTPKERKQKFAPVSVMGQRRSAK
jgi:WhiB family redox-sensing transcriptional regulator